jgi:hypothetical protein
MRVLFLVLAACFLAPNAKAHTHNSEDGTTVSWYPNECCNDGDCRPVAMVQPAGEGLWVTTVDGLTLLVGPNDHRRVSQDMRWHVCIAADDTNTLRIRCIFEPPNT